MTHRSKPKEDIMEATPNKGVDNIVLKMQTTIAAAEHIPS